MLITSNRSVAEWGAVFADPVSATAILDRLLHHSHVLTIRGDSYRLRVKKTSAFARATCSGCGFSLPYPPPPAERAVTGQDQAGPAAPTTGPGTAAVRCVSASDQDRWADVKASCGMEGIRSPSRAMFT